MKLQGLGIFTDYHLEHPRDHGLASVTLMTSLVVLDKGLKEPSDGNSRITVSSQTKTVM